MNQRTSQKLRERRVLHLVEDLEPHGIGPWLLELVHQQSRMDWDADLCVLSRSRAALAAQFETEGCRVFQCAPSPRALLPLRIWRLLKRRGPYRSVHAHLSGAARPLTQLGLCLAGARLARIPSRVIHLHAAAGDARNFAGEALARRFATEAISPSHGRTAEWSCLTANDGLTLVETPYGISLDDAAQPVAVIVAARGKLGIPKGAPVVGMIAREGDGLSSAAFLRVAEEILRVRTDARFVLAGDAALRRWFDGQVRIMNLAERAIFVNRPANPQEMPLGLFDVLLLTTQGSEPPFLLLKAQSAGLLVALGGDAEPMYVVLPQSVARVPEGSGLDGWAAAAVSLLGGERLSPVAASNLVAARGFDTAAACRRVLAIYGRGNTAEDVAPARGSLAGASPAKSAGRWYA